MVAIYVVHVPKMAVVGLEPRKSRSAMMFSMGAKHEAKLQ